MSKNKRNNYNVLKRNKSTFNFTATQCYLVYQKIKFRYILKIFIVKNNNKRY